MGGNTLKRKIEVTSMAESPGPRRRLESHGASGSKLEDAPPRTNSKLQDTSKSFTNGQQSTVEITLSGRTRSREDLCPDRPRSRFEHAVWWRLRPETLTSRLLSIQTSAASSLQDVNQNDLDNRLTVNSEHDLTMERILNRTQPLSSRRLTKSRPVTPIEDFRPVDVRWLSDDSLVQPRQIQDKWWLSGGPEVFLDTRPAVFGRKKVYLVDRKFPKSENDIVHLSRQSKWKISNPI